MTPAIRDTSLKPEPPIAVEDMFISAQDGLRIHVRAYGDRNAASRPVVCLPGLTRSARDFDDLARTLASTRKQPKWVLCLDYRGRGRSDHDRNWRNYNVIVEMRDVLAMLAALDIEEADFIGTSRGGIVAMLLSATRPGAIRTVVLNDVGPVIELQGLVRIKRMLADLKPPATWAGAITDARHFHASSFPQFGNAEWEKLARQTYRDDDGYPAIEFDRALRKTLTDISSESPPPTLWPQFIGLSPKPTLVLRGALSTLLSEGTVLDMQAVHRNLTVHTVPDQGHAPTLWDEDTQNRIVDFIDMNA